MTTNRRQMLLTATAAALAAGAPSLAAAGSSVSAPVANFELAAVLDAFVDEMLRDSPETATTLGLDTGKYAAERSKLNDRSAAARRNAVADYADRARRLAAIPRASLSGYDLTLYDTVLYAQQAGAEGGRFSYGVDTANPYVVSQQGGLIANGPEFLNAQHQIAGKADADSYIARLGLMGAALDQETDRIQADAGAGVILPDFILAKTLGQLTAFRRTAAAEQGVVKSVTERTKAKGVAGDYAGQATALVEQKVYPALDRQIAALQALQSRATADAGVWKLPEGAAYYVWGLREGTTTEMTPAEIHQMGLDQGAAIDAQLDQLLKAHELTQGSVGERMGALTKDPRFLYPNTDEGRAQLIAYLNGKIAEIRPHMADLSKLGLKAPVQVKRVPPDIEAGAGLGYMNFASLDGTRPAIYYVNLADTGNWPRHTLTSLTMHEAIPGHAWQGAYLSERQDEVHRIASFINFNAFIEGWALYAEQLADEARMYKDDPFSRLGYLQAQRFRAARLVVDSGLHDKRWTRTHAIEWMVAATGRSNGAVSSEVDRYCVAPGQACGYKVGHTEIVRQREKAKTALGSRFDIRDYNDAVVSTGGAPLTVLESVIDRYVAGAKA
ncbi:MAG: DUF885 family protein [Phenylobacterium sp.]|uniref:DUF885 domain-containing protein n=1 Tax=Phenylobacterium sp. TaxID=1871053 RepID=UPI0027357F74|nr:DUF885 family protein [Phenylobacterium sp.]MDP3749568.1 DUF885 family protein [Phenylobacterium sp.]